MTIIEQSIAFGRETFILTNQRAVFWPAQRALLLSDLHLGKAAHFRKNGIALPTQVTVQDLQRLKALIDHYEPAQVIVVGDLLHAGANTELRLLKELIHPYTTTRFILIKGNHDRFPDYALQDMGIHPVHPALHIEGIELVHQASADNGLYITGHIHPGVSLQFPDKRRLNLPCYVVTPNQLILPAFSLFTGLDTRSVDKAVYYAFYEEGIFKIV
ncbi:ligase-associated DNA damage response endonuclease PdeM [Terrimonas rubra]|uniref:Ligase-associated DNA damage response endonuclease PdeM n=1 Tax=Terrimonas rubra TaxID=1035890 RepID=A0ABW6A7S5_9BACT